MKKIISLILVLLLFGCSKDPLPDLMNIIHKEEYQQIQYEIPNEEEFTSVKYDDEWCKATYPIDRSYICDHLKRRDEFDKDVINLLVNSEYKIIKEQSLSNNDIYMYVTFEKELNTIMYVYKTGHIKLKIEDEYYYYMYKENPYSKIEQLYTDMSKELYNK